MKESLANVGELIKAGVEKQASPMKMYGKKDPLFTYDNNLTDKSCELLKTDDLRIFKGFLGNDSYK